MHSLTFVEIWVSKLDFVSLGSRLQCWSFRLSWRGGWRWGSCWRWGGVHGLSRGRRSRGGGGRWWRRGSSGSSSIGCLCLRGRVSWSTLKTDTRKQQNCYWERQSFSTEVFGGDKCSPPFVGWHHWCPSAGSQLRPASAVAHSALAGPYQCAHSQTHCSVTKKERWQ